MADDQIASLIRQALGANGLQNLASNPLVAQLLGRPQETPPVVTIEQPAASSLTEQEILLVHLFRGFVATDEGNPVVGLLTKFARFAQSEVDKAKVKQPQA